MHEKLSRIISILLTLLMLLVFLISVGQFFCGSRFWFEREFAAHENEIATEYGSEEAVRISCETMDYLLGQRDRLDEVKATGSDQAFFNNRELHHLSDCRVIFLRMIRVRNIALVISTIGVLILLATKKAAIFARSFIGTIRIAAVAAVVSVIVFAINFDKAYDFVHEMLFDNYLWIMNPATDNLVNLMTIDIISETAGIILTVWICISLFLGKAVFRKLVPTESLIERIRILAS